MRRTIMDSLLLILLFLWTPAADDAVAADLDKLQGTWKLVSYERNGKPLPSEQVKDRIVVIADQQWTDRTGDAIHGQGTITLDVKTTPRSIDTTFTVGFPKGKTSLGIYELTGDTLRSCVAEPGGERPQEFAAPAGSSRIFVSYLRQK
jgi:uncharacterized protein (TIGR03067 family)